jgi:hypothetical protein
MRPLDAEGIFPVYQGMMSAFAISKASRVQTRSVLSRMERACFAITGSPSDSHISVRALQERKFSGITTSEYHRGKRVMIELTNRGNVEMCPFIKRGLDDCYCMDLNSLNIEKSIYYCQHHFSKCEIYKELYFNKQEKTQNDFI